MKTKQLVAAEEAKCQVQLKEQQLHFDKELEKHLDFAQNIVTDKVERTWYLYVANQYALTR